jgi:hypothetical protein
METSGLRGSAVCLATVLLPYLRHKFPGLQPHHERGEVRSRMAPIPGGGPQASTPCVSHAAFTRPRQAPRLSPYFSFRQKGNMISPRAERPVGRRRGMCDPSSIGLQRRHTLSQR